MTWPCSLVILGFLIVGLRLYADGPPEAHTGGFGEPTCMECHDGEGLNPEGGSFDIAGLPDTPVPGDTALIRIQLVRPRMGRAGFQAAIRFSDGSQAGEWIPTSDREMVTEADGVQYASHSWVGSEVSGDTASWALRWIAPSDSGNVVLHAAGNAGNGDDSPFDDAIYTWSSAH